MYIYFGFKNWGDPILLQLSPETMSTYMDFKRERVWKILFFTLLMLVTGFLYINTMIPLSPALEFGDLKLIFLVICCGCVFGLYKALVSKKTRACLIYACLNTDDFENYLKTVLDSLQEYLKVEHLYQTQITNKIAKRLHKKIYEAQTLLGLSNIMKKEEQDVIFKAILKAGDIEEFYTDVFKYEIK